MESDVRVEIAVCGQQPMPEERLWFGQKGWQDVLRVYWQIGAQRHE